MYSEQMPSRYHVRDSDERGALFFLVIFVLFIATGLWRAMTPQQMTDRANELAALNAQMPIQVEAFNVTVDSINAACQANPTWSFEDFFKARNRLYPFIDYFSETGKWDIYRVVLEAWQAKAEKNCLEKGLIPMLEQNAAETKIGEPPLLTMQRQQSGSRIGTFAANVALHGLWYCMVVPFLFLGRVIVRNRYRFRIAFEEITCRTIWLVQCSLLWPFCFLRHADAELRPTNRFYLLRFWYLLANRKFFLSMAEKNALLHQAGSAEQDVGRIFSYVQGVAESATGRARKYAIVTFFTTLFPIQFAGQAALSLAQSQAPVVETKVKKTEFSLNGYAISTVNEEAPHVKLEMVRIKPKWTNGKFSLALEVDPTSAVQVKVAAIGYDVSPEFHVQVGRLVTPFAWLYPSPLNQPTLHLPLGPLLMPFNDNGVLVNGEIGPFNYRFGELNGPGAYQDDNEKMDYVGQIGVKLGNARFGFTEQQGKQKNGTLRILHVADASITVGPASLRTLVVERPDMRKRGLMTELLVRAGPNMLVCLYDEVQGTRVLDLGFNRKCTDELTILGHVVLNSGANPIFGVQLKHTFKK